MALQPRNRVISQSTGLYKFQLPEKQPSQNDNSSEKPKEKPSDKPPSKPLVNISVHESSHELQIKKTNTLLAKYSEKQALLLLLEKQAEKVRFELLEILAALQPHQQNQGDFLDRATKEVKKRVSTIFQNTNTQRDLRKSASTVFSTAPQLKNKASAMFTSTLSDVKERLDLTELKTFWTSLSPLTPKKATFSTSDPAVLADSSFMLENIHLSESTENESLLGEINDGLSTSTDLAPIDIDDYDSESE